jgi:hypothetical protein
MMTAPYRSPYASPEPYVPASLSEIYDFLASMIFGAPRYDRHWAGEQGLEYEFKKLALAFERVRNRLGDERYEKVMDLAHRAKALIAEDQDETNGKTNEGRELLFEIEDVIQEVRRKRAKAKIKDDDGEVTGD